MIPYGKLKVGMEVEVRIRKKWLPAQVIGVHAKTYEPLGAGKGNRRLDLLASCVTVRMGSAAERGPSDRKGAPYHLYWPNEKTFAQLCTWAQLRLKPEGEPT